MANTTHVVANKLASRPTILSRGSTHQAQLTRSNTSSSEGSYEPLPQGRWILGLHGNCPKCHHHHKAVQVKVKVNHDANQVNHVHCERCKAKWAAFGGQNTTRISLLSSLTEEPDGMDEQVRYSLIEMVRSATTIALGAIPELVPSGQPVSHYSASSHKATPTISQPSIPTTGGLPTDTPNPPPWPNTLNRSDAASVTRYDQRSYRNFIAKAKQKGDTLIQNLGGESLRKWVYNMRQPSVSARKLEKSRVPEVPAEETVVYPLQHSLLGTVPASYAPQPDEQCNISSKTESPMKARDPTTFLRNLETPSLGSVSENSASHWIRKNYTEFKNRNVKAQSPLGLSTIFGTSIAPMPYQNHNTDQDHGHPTDFLGIGGVAEGLGYVTNNTSRWRFSISDQPHSDTPTIASYPRYSGPGHLQRSRHRMIELRHRSLPNARFPSQMGESMVSLDYRTFREGNRSASAIIHSASTALSQASTARSSMSGHFHPSTSQNSLVARSSQRHSIEVHPPLPSSSTQHSDNGTEG